MGYELFFPPMQQRTLHTALMLAQCWSYSEKNNVYTKTKSSASSKEIHTELRLEEF